MEFKAGDVVQLKSGGPRMTVSMVGDYTRSGGPVNGVLCVWFETVKGVQKREEHVFDAVVLEPAPSRGSGVVRVSRA